MKKIIVLMAVLVFATNVMAKVHHRHIKPRKKHFKIAKVKGEKAQAIFEALDTEIITKNGIKATKEIKKVSSLRCVKAISKNDTSKIRYRCILKGKKGKRGFRRHHRRHGRRFHQQRSHK